MDDRPHEFQRFFENRVGMPQSHVITITPKTFVGKLMTPLLGPGVPKQTQDAMHALKAIRDS